MKKLNKKNLNWVNGKIEGVIYRYVLDKKDSSENGFSYVGETLTEAERKKSWRNSGNKTYGGTKCRKARETYGWKSFRYEVLEKLYSDDIDTLQKMLEEREGYWIEKFDSVENGFNTSHQGTGLKGVKLSEQQRKKCGDNRRGKPQSDEAKKKISDSQKGKTLKEDTKEKISKGNSGKKRTVEQNEAQSSRLKGITPVAATNGAKEWVKKNGGGYWKNHKISDEARANMKAAQQKRATPVISTSPNGTEQRYPSMLDAAKEFGLGVGSICNFIKTGRTSKEGFTFRKAS